MKNMDKSEIFKKFVSENSALVCLETDNDWNILTANKFADHLFGKPLKGLSFRTFIVDFSGNLDFDAMARQPEKKHMLNVNTSSGLPQTFYFSFYQAGNTWLVFGETNSLEVEELRKSFISLNNDLNNLTRKLQKKNVQLNKLNDQKNEFIGMAAHDLRNPISIIMGYSEFILESARDQLHDTHIRFIKIIIRSSEFMLNMLNELLDIAKIESGKLNLEKERINPKKLINNNVALNRVIAEKKDIKINVEIFEELPEIMADPNKLDQVLSNLLSNAIKFSNSGSTIKVSSFKSNEGLTIAVKDQGQGISDEDKEKLFKPFSRFSTIATAGEKSTGLGLTITKKIIMGHGGKIWLESKVGVGTTFYFSLPFG